MNPITKARLAAQARNPKTHSVGGSFSLATTSVPNTALATNMSAHPGLTAGFAAAGAALGWWLGFHPLGIVGMGALTAIAATKLGVTYTATATS